MKRKTLFIVILLCTLFLACAKDKEQEEDISKAIEMARLDIINDPEYLYIKNIYDEFPAIKSVYSFSKDEKEAIGMWLPSLYYFDYYFKKKNYEFTLFPNRLAFIWIVIKANDEPRALIRKLLGIWEIKENTIFIEVRAYEYNIPDSVDKYKYFLLSKPIKYKILDTNAINPDGYTTKKSYKITLPGELIKKYQLKIKQIDGAIYFRSFKYANIVASNEYFYREFEYIDEMAKQGITGEMIVNDPEKYRKYLEF